MTLTDTTITGCQTEAITLAQQAAGGGNFIDKPSFAWDTDNLRYETYTAKTFGVPFHDYSGYTVATDTYQVRGIDYTRNNEPCQSAVADAFFQTGTAWPATKYSNGTIGRSSAGVWCPAGAANGTKKASIDGEWTTV